MTPTIKHVAPRAQMVAKPGAMDVIVITGSCSSPSGTSIGAIRKRFCRGVLRLVLA